MTDMNKKIFYLSSCAFGFSLAGTLQITYLSTILQFAGFKPNLINYIWMAPPLTGLICQPIIGVLSDNISTRWGQRRPLFLFSTLFGVLGLIFLPFIHNLLLVLILIIFLDIGTNGNAQLSRALIFDVTKGKQRVKALSWSSALSGLGAVLSCALPWLLINLFHFSTKSGVGGTLPFYIQFIFPLSAGFYLFFSLITLIKVKEQPLHTKNESKRFIPTLKAIFFSSKKLSRLFWKLTYILFFSWFAVFTVWNYLNITLAQTIFHMPVEWGNHLEKSAPYISEANVWTAGYFGVMQLTSTLFSFFIPRIERYISTSLLFTIGLFIGGLSLIFISLITDKFWISFFMILYGLFWATLQICPYAIFAKIIPRKNNAFYLGIFNIAVVVPQLIAGLFLGNIYKYIFNGQAKNIILMAGSFLLVSVFFSIFLNKIKFKIFLLNQKN